MCGKGQSGVPGKRRNISLLEKIKSKLLQKDVVDFYKSKPLVATDRKAKKLVPLALIALASGAIGAIYGLPRIRDRDGDGLSDWYEKHLGTDPNKPNPNVAYALKNGLDEKYVDLIKPLDSDGRMQFEEKKWDQIIINNRESLVVPTLLSYLSNQSKDGKITTKELNGADNFTWLVREMYDVIVSEDKARDKLGDTDYGAKLGLELGFDKERATEATAKAIGEYAVAVKDEALPEELDALKLLTEGTQNEQYGEKLVDFSPIIFHSVDGKDVVLVVDKPRDTWLLARHMKALEDNGYDILKHPEAFEGLNAQVIANAWSIFDAEYGIAYIEKEHNGRVVKPTDADVEQLMLLQWQLYDKARQGKYYNRDFPWWNSDKLDELYADKNTRRQALLFLWYLPNATWDMEKQEIVSGMKGAETALKQAWEEYQKISELYPDGTLTHDIWGEVDLRWYYYDWVEDRGIHELENTHIQYVGLKPLELWDIITKHPLDYWNYLKDYDGIDQYLTKNWQYWDLVKAIASYERWNPNIKWEEEGVYYTIPQTLQMFGFPVTHITINPEPKGTVGSEWAVSLPDYVAESLKTKFSNQKILLGPGNIFGLYSSGNGLEKDGIKDVFVWILSCMESDKRIYLMKKS